jgi:hypothetical protein
LTDATFIDASQTLSEWPTPVAARLTVTYRPALRERRNRNGRLIG